MRETANYQKYFALMLLIVFCFMGNAAKQGAVNGLKLCYFSLIPSLFPFLIAGNLLSSLVNQVKFQTPMCRFLKLTPTEYIIFWLSQFGGYPMGAKLLQEGVNQKNIQANRAEKLVNFCFGCGPGFAVVYVGSLLKGKNFGVIIFICCILSNLLMLAITKDKLPPIINYSADTKTNLGITICAGVQNGTLAMLYVCGCVVFYSVLTNILQTLLPRAWSIMPFIEVCGGTNIWAGKTAFAPAYAAALSFGGLAVHSQIKMIADSTVKPASMLKSRIQAAVLSGLLVFAAIKLLPYHIVASINMAVTVFSPGANIWCNAFLVLFVVSTINSMVSALQPSNDLIK